MSTTAPEVTVLPVSVLMRCTQRVHRGWSYPAWEVAGLLPDEEGHGETPSGGVVHAVEGTSDYLWRGLRFRLVRSNAETYWFNLTGTRPRAFVICRPDSAGQLVPVMVTLDQDEATRQLEGDGEVFEVVIPAPVQEVLERFVMTHYQPRPRRRGRRRSSDDDGR
ncbi:DUF3305 domain-containing protein [Arhodomonas sp. SL1]|uniref:DUF3305 domain-containing protein n=1 Tax=Arhodomonas sp. SL1 TaxID=3425691 RepID=UPI003F883A15